MAGHLELLQTSLWKGDGRQDTFGSPQGAIRGGLLSSHILKFPVVLLEALLKEVNPKLLTFPFHLKTGTDVFTPYQGCKIAT